MNISINSVLSLFRKGGNGIYQFGYNLVHGATQFNQYHKDKEKLAMVLSNPAALKVFSIQCDLFSMGHVGVSDADENDLPDDPFYKLIGQPNPFQGRSQFLWDYMFWQMMGTAYCYVDSAIVDRPENRMYFLDPGKMEWPLEFDQNKDKLIMSDQTVKEIFKTIITYRYDDGTTFKFPLSKLAVIHDLSNGLGNWYKSPSKLDALYKVVSNSEHALDSKNINVRYTGKFLVGSTNDTSKVGLSDAEKNDIVGKIDTMEKRVWPLKTMVEIRRFVDDMASLQLGQAYLEDYFIIGNMYGIPRDVLEAYQSATYENQEKARAAHVSYCFEPKGNQFMDALQNMFGYTKEGKNIYMDWSHLPFMQVFEQTKATTQQYKINSLSILLGMGVPLDQANSYLGTSFEIPEVDGGANSETIKAQAALRGSVGGVQGIINLQTGVAQGTLTRESAEGILIVVYGFTSEEATQILGPEQEINPANQGGQGGANSGQGNNQEEQ